MHGRMDEQTVGRKDKQMKNFFLVFYFVPNFELTF